MQKTTVIKSPSPKLISFLEKLVKQRDEQRIELQRRFQNGEFD